LGPGSPAAGLPPQILAEAPLRGAIRAGQVRLLLINNNFKKISFGRRVRDLRSLPRADPKWPGDLAPLIREVGFARVSYRPLSNGIAVVHLGTRN
jgi:hypothetical protein